MRDCQGLPAGPSESRGSSGGKEGGRKVRVRERLEDAAVLAGRLGEGATGRQPCKAAQERKQVLPCRFQRECGPANTVMWARTVP